MEPPAVRTGRWFAVIAMKYFESGGFWDRDAGLFYQGFRANGIDSRLVAIGEPCVRQDKPLILAPQSQMEDPNWWKQWNLTGVVLYSWALPRFMGITRAIKAAGVKVLIPLDADGGRSPRQWFFRYLHVKYIYSKMEGKWLPWGVARAKTLGGLLKSRYAETLEHMSLADLLGIGSPLAKQRFGRFLSAHDRADLLDRLVVLHHPIANHMVYDPAVAKKQIIIAVGSWDRLIKGAPLLVQVLGLALEREPAYRARIIGRGQDWVRKLAAKLPGEVRERIEITGPLPNETVARHYQEAQIVVNTSYSESFSLATAEALCCGCSAVGTALMSCMNHYCSNDSGTLACNRSKYFYCDAIRAEAEAWSTGLRDPRRLSAVWTARLHADKVARSVIELSRQQDHSSAVRVDREIVAPAP
jgi:glycosyltransferase involved in cell wall biosynthesis